MRPLPEQRNSPRYVLSQDGKNQRSPGTGSEECKHSSRLPPDPITGDASLGPFREPGAGGTVDCPRFPAAAAGWATSRKPSGWTEKARLVQAAVEAVRIRRADGIRPYPQHGSLCVGAGVPTGPSTAQPNSMAQTRRPQWERQAQSSATPGPSGPGEEVGATQILPAGRNFPPKGPQKTAFWFLCRRGQRNPPPERRNSPKNKKAGATGKAAPLFCVQNGRRSETKFRRKFFCLLFFSRKVGRPLFPQ